MLFLILAIDENGEVLAAHAGIHERVFQEKVEVRAQEHVEITGLDERCQVAIAGG